MRTRTWMLSAAAVAAMACGSSTDTPATPTQITYTAVLTGASERPTPVVSSGSGTFTGILDVATNAFTWSVAYTGLTAASTASHIHVPATAEQAANPVLFFNLPAFGGTPFVAGSTSGAFTGGTTLNASTSISSTINGDSLRKLMDAGLAYVNVHSTFAPGGEIRGQIVRKQ